MKKEIFLKNFWKFYSGLVVWLAVYCFSLMWILDFASMSENTTLYFLLLVLYYFPLFILNIATLLYFVWTIRKRQENIWKVIGGVMFVGMLDTFSFLIFFFITFSLYGFGP